MFDVQMERPRHNRGFFAGLPDELGPFLTALCAERWKQWIAGYLAGWKDVVLVEDKTDFWLPSITPRRENIPSCITVTSSSTRMRG
jgi:hypothetical protein